MGKEILIIGTGNMAIDYLNVLKDLGGNITVVGRGIESRNKFLEKTGFFCHAGGIQSYINDNPNRDWSQSYIIIAVGTESLTECLLTCVKLNPKAILVEKPGAISISELIENYSKINSHYKNIFIAYNRRFYSSVSKVTDLINADGGLISFNFEFTEWADTITPLKKANGVKENWLFANSTHVIDLAFFLGGKPEKLSSIVSKSKEIDWHKNSIFSGSGVSKDQIPFSYFANWESAGRWGIELCTLKNKYYLKPLEKIFIQKRGSILLEEYIFDQEIDKKYKPGLFLQTKAFIDEDYSKLVSMEEQYFNAKNIYKIIQEGN